MKKQTTTNDSLGTFIKINRKKVGKSQITVAKELNLETAQSVSNLERGLVPLPANKVKPLAKILKINPKHLITLSLMQRTKRYLKAAGIRNIDEQIKKMKNMS
jgi:transcriptional regulator with XRE-family HTH domain